MSKIKKSKKKPSLLLLFTTISCLLFLSLEYITRLSITDSDRHLIFIYVSIFLSTIISTFYYCVSYQLRHSNKFWEEAHKLEKSLNESTTKEQLKYLQEHDLVNLTNLCLGSPHSYELKRLDSLIKMKFNFVN